MGGERQSQRQGSGGSRTLRKDRNEKGGETGKEEVLLWLKYLNAHPMLHPPLPSHPSAPSNSTFLFTECTNTKSAFT